VHLQYEDAMAQEYAQHTSDHTWPMKLTWVPLPYTILLLTCDDGAPQLGYTANQGPPYRSRGSDSGRKRHSCKCIHNFN
jgi:hypothetical protein